MILPQDTRPLTAKAVLFGTSLLAAAPVIAGMDSQSPDARDDSQATSSSQQASQPITERLPGRYQLSHWLDKTVKNASGETLGKVDELIMDDLGRVRYVILKSEMLADNAQGDLMAVPVGHFAFPLAREDHLVLDATSRQISEAPAFDQSAGVPNMGRPEVSSVIVAYWVTEEAADRSAGQQQNRSDSAGKQQTTGSADYEGNRDIIKLSKQKAELFEKLDRNDSGAIERSEAQEHQALSERFAEIDTYRNEAITRSEFSAFEPNGGQTGGKDQQPG